MPAHRVPLTERFWAKVNISADGCWTWTGATTGLGYGTIGAGSPSRAMLLAHRLSYEMHVGSIPEGLELDHLCFNPACVNPAHLEPVTHTENLRRASEHYGIRGFATHCPAGHPYDEENTLRRNGKRHCRACSGLLPNSVSRGRNSDRTECPRGHPYTSENTRVDKKGSRSCKKCERERVRRWRAQQKESQ